MDSFQWLRLTSASFLGAMTTFPAQQVWKASIEPKCKFFAWLVLHNKALTVDNMIKKYWECNPICSLCFCQQETTAHLLIHCNYAEALWNIIAERCDLPDYITMSNHQDPVQWVCFLLRSGDKRTERNRLGILFCFWWQLWKERNRRIFQNAELSVNQVAAIIQRELTLRYLDVCLILLPFIIGRFGVVCSWTNVSP
jgi:hypothetical protein